ncbi:zinc finger protein 37 homolog [Anopheles arabiensis]|nr:zinc finger protein 37 homolog [Anopheles arabiensis]
MANVQPDMLHLCRFCLCPNKEQTIVIGKTLSFTFTIADVRRSTGVSVSRQDALKLRICFKCLGSVKSSTDFRHACIRNDSTFRELSVRASSKEEPVTSAQKEPAASTKEEPVTSAQKEPVISAKQEPIKLLFVPNTPGADPLELKIEILVDIDKDIKTEPLEDDTNITGQDLNAAVPVNNIPNANIPDIDPLEVKVETLTDKDIKTEPKKEATTIVGQDLNATVPSEKVAEEEEYKAPYSANNVELGEPFSDDTDDELRKRKRRPRSSKPESWEKVSVPSAKANKQTPCDNGGGALNPSMPKKRKHYKRPLTLCEICGKVVADYKAHILTHKEAGYSCPFCPAKVAHPANFARHVQQVHEKRIVRSCELCGKGCIATSSLVSHMRSQHGIGKLHECSMCSSKFKHPSGLNMHIRNVHRSDMHTCETCGKIFKVREALRRHYRTHSSEQPYGCRQCTKRFRSSYARTIHELTHAGVVFRCTHCDKSYRYKSQLMLHLRKSHPESQTATERASSEEVEQNPEIEVPIKDEFPTRKNVPSKKKKSK